MNHFEEVVLFFGNKNRLAKVLGISPVAISRWKHKIPPGRAYQIEVLTNGKFKALDLIKGN